MAMRWTEWTDDIYMVATLLTSEEELSRPTLGHSTLRSTHNPQQASKVQIKTFSVKIA
jgi:hypothetical protein